MSSESDTIKELLSSTGSELYKQIGLYLHELEFTSDILDEEDDFAHLFAEKEDCERIGIPSDNDSKLKHFIISRSEHIIVKHNDNKLKALQLKNVLMASNSDIYKKIGDLLFEYQVYCEDINEVDDLKIFLNKANCIKLGLKNAAKQKLAFRKVLRMIQDTQKQQSTKSEEKEIETIETQKKEQQIDPLMALLNNEENISADSLWSHFFQKQKNVKDEIFKDAIKDILKKVNVSKCKTKIDEKRLSEMSFIECIMLKIKSMNKDEQKLDILYDSFKEYAKIQNNDDDIIKCFDDTQSEFYIYYAADQKKDFSLFEMDTFEQRLTHFYTFRTLLSSDFELDLWKFIICQNVQKHSSNLLKLAIKTKEIYSNDTGLKVFESELFSKSDPMSLFISDSKSSFYSLSESELQYVLKLDCLAIDEEKLFDVMRIWSSRNVKNKSFEEAMSPFLAFIRFPLMSMQYLLKNVLPIKDKLFVNKDDFLFIVICKMNVLCSNEFKFDFDKLCCSHDPRIYQQQQRKNNEENMSLDERLNASLAKNKLLQTKYDELKKKNEKLSKKKRKSTKTKDMESAIDALSSNGRNRGRSVTNMFTSVDHAMAMQNKRDLVNAKSKKAEDSIDLAQRQKHLKQVSQSVIKTVSDLQTGSSSVNFIVKANADNQANKDIFEQMRKKLTDRKEKVKTAHQRKLEKEKEEKMQKEKEQKEAKKVQKENKKKRKKKIVKTEHQSMDIQEETNENDEEKILNEMNRLNQELSNEQSEIIDQNDENDYGYSEVHSAFKQYFEVNGEECSAAPKLLLFAKKNGISGVTFANSNKYLKARKNDSNAMSMTQQNENENEADKEDDDDGSVQSGHSEHFEGNDEENKNKNANEDEIDTPPITITQSLTDKHKTPDAPLQNDEHEQNENADDAKQQRQQQQQTEVKKKKKKKKNKTLLIAADVLGKLKKTTNYTRFEMPLYILELNVAQKKKQKDEQRMIRDMGLQMGYMVELKQKNMRGMVKFIGSVHFTYGVVVGLEMSGNGNGNHQGDMDKIKYFDCKRNGGLFVRVDSIQKVIEKKKLKSSKKSMEMDKVTQQRFDQMLNEIGNEEDDEDDELDLSPLSKKERIRLERLHLEIGDVVEVDKGRKGILHFYGNVHWTDDVIFGVELLDKAVGKYNGTYGDVAYFKCAEKRGMFFTSDKIRKKGVFEGLSEW